MTDPGALSSWWVAPPKLSRFSMPLLFTPAKTSSILRTPAEGIFSFNDEAPKPRPRAWERAPKSPILARHHGRKVWKRYEAPQKAETKDGSGDADESTRQALCDATNTPRPVKRLRLKNAPKAENDGKENIAAHYFTTLLDQENAGTPKRKQASKKSLKSDNARFKARSADDNMPRMIKQPTDVVENDTLRTRESPALEEPRKPSSSGDDALEIEPSNASECSDEVPRDDTILETEGATSSENTTNTGPTNSTEVPLENESLTLSEMVIVADEAIKMDHAVASTQAVSEDADSIVMGSDASSAVKAIVPSPFRHEATANAEGAIVSENGSALSSSAPHSPSVPEALASDNAAISSSPLIVSPEAFAWKKLVIEQPNFNSSLTPSADAKTPKRTSPRKKLELLPPHPVTTPGVNRTPKTRLFARSLRADDTDETPQIGTSLLRRESLRRKESPSKKKDARKSKTPKKRDTLQRRDTLQEREILQKVIAESNADHSDETLDIAPIETSTLPSSSSRPGAEDQVEDDVHGFPEPVLDTGSVTGAEAVLPAVDEPNVEKDLHRAIEAIEIYEQPDVISDDHQGMKALEKANEVLAKTELDDVSQAMEATREHTPNQKTRSGARFSDDTSLLKDFLNRAQARKAAQKPVLSVPDAPISQNSPRRSPRKTHGSQDGHVSSPRKLRNIANRPGTPPGKPKTEALESDDSEDPSAEPASCRRSTRTRVLAPSKAAPGAPSFIPVRRADGTDPVVLQKSQAQEVAVTTRANTRRNKGQSKPPLLALRNLATEIADLSSTGRQAEKAKSVGWAERLASYQDAKGEADEAEDKRHKVRRLRGLGAVAGTPATKRRTAVVGTSNGTPAAKGRGKVR